LFYIITYRKKKTILTIMIKVIIFLYPMYQNQDLVEEGEFFLLYNSTF